jgi:hypothetical protein
MLHLYHRKDLRIVITSWQLLLDAAECTGWANSGRYDDMTTLLQIGLGDSTVSTIAGRIMAANLNSSQFMPTPFPTFDVGHIVANQSVGVDILFQGIYPHDEASLPKNSAIPNPGTNVHECMQSQPEVILQNSLFISNDKIVNPCGRKVCTLRNKEIGCN